MIGGKRVKDGGGVEGEELWRGEGGRQEVDGIDGRRVQWYSDGAEVKEDGGGDEVKEGRRRN